MDEEFGPAALAIFTGNLDQLSELLKADPRLATRRSLVSHPTLLQLVACEEPNIADPVGAARLLVDAGAATSLPLVSAAGCDSRAVAEFLLDADVGVDGEDLWTPLDEALYWANADMAAFLVERGATIRALSTAAGLGELGAARLGDGPIGSPFVDTVPPERADDPQAIVDHAFVMAVNNGRRRAAEELLRRGAEISATPPGYHWHGTALHAAAWRGDRELAEWLLGEGADPTIRDGLANSDAIGWANHHGHPELVEVLNRAS